jgi:hypothetical protein
MTVSRTLTIVLTPVRLTALYVGGVVLLMLPQLFFLEPRPTPLTIVSATIGVLFLALGVKIMVLVMRDRWMPHPARELPVVRLLLFLFLFALIGFIFVLPLLRSQPT